MKRIGTILAVALDHRIVGDARTGYVRRNGAPISDQAMMTTHFRRHGDLLTLTLIMDAPVYLTES